MARLASLVGSVACFEGPELPSPVKDFANCHRSSTPRRAGVAFHLAKRPVCAHSRSRGVSKLSSCKRRIVAVNWPRVSVSGMRNFRKHASHGTSNSGVYPPIRVIRCDLRYGFECSPRWGAS